MKQYINISFPKQCTTWNLMKNLKSGDKKSSSCTNDLEPLGQAPALPKTHLLQA